MCDVVEVDKNNGEILHWEILSGMMSNVSSISGNL